MAKDRKDKKKADKAKKGLKSGKGGKKSKKASGKLGKVASGAGKIATGVIVEEIVAATLVAAAAAIRDPKKARAMAASAGSELRALTDEAAKEGSALWHLALDVASQSLEFLAKAKSGKSAAPAASTAVKRKPKMRR